MIEQTYPPISLAYNYYFSLFTIAGLVVLTAVWTLTYFYSEKIKMCLLGAYNKFGGERTLISIAMIKILSIALGISFVTLVYSEVWKYEPCVLCWWQRVFLYSQIPVIAAGLYMKDKNVFVYSSVLSAVGFAIALYHHFLQSGYDMFKPCSDAPFAVDCAKPSFIEFGFVTFPLMSVFAFALVFTIAWWALKLSKKV